MSSRRPQVCTQGIARSGDRTVKPWAGVEAVASLALHHPGVMRTLNHTTVVVPAPAPRSSSVRHASLHAPEVSPSGCGPWATCFLSCSKLLSSNLSNFPVRFVVRAASPSGRLAHQCSAIVSDCR